MAEPGVYLEKLSAFSRMLRLHGFAVSPNETADAGRILAALGISRRKITYPERTTLQTLTI